jgi:hypothetical protein
MARKPEGPRSGPVKEADASTKDKIANAALSREMLAAGLTAAAAAIAASRGTRRKIRDAGLEAADTASSAATQMMTSASKLGSLIAEAVADAAQRVLSGDWANDNDKSETKSTNSRKRAGATKRKSARKSPGRKTTIPKKGIRKTLASGGPASAANTAASGHDKPRSASVKPRKTSTRRPATARKPGARPGGTKEQ